MSSFDDMQLPYFTDWTTRFVRVGGIEVLPAGYTFTAATLRNFLGSDLYDNALTSVIYRPAYGMAIGQSCSGSTPAQGARFDGGSISFLPASRTPTAWNYQLRVNDAEGNTLYSRSGGTVNFDGGEVPRFMLQAVQAADSRNGFHGFGGVLCRGYIWTKNSFTAIALNEFSVFLGFQEETHGSINMSLEQIAFKILHKTW